MAPVKKQEIRGKEARPRGRPRLKPSPAQPAPNRATAYIAATGRRKTAVARVRLTQVTSAAEFSINAKPLPQYFPQPDLQELVLAPLKTVGKENELSGSVKVSGGGYHSQAEAIRHGVARALLKLDAALRPSLKPHGFLRRDPRMKERKKPGLRRARRAPQWAKR